MSSNYPEGSMMGSGIYVKEFDVNMECTHCGHTWDTIVSSDDWGKVDETITCVLCHRSFFFTMDTDEDQGEWSAEYEEERDLSYENE